MAFAAVALSGSLLFASEARIRGDVVRLGDVANVAVLPEAIRAQATALRLARFQPGPAQADVPIDFLAAQARSQMPVLAIWMEDQSGERITLRRALSPSGPRVLASRPEGIARSEQVTVRVDVGAFRIEREATAMDDAKPGEKLFVRTADRRVISAICQTSE